MRNIVKDRHYKKNISTAFILLRFALILYIAIFAGMFSGNILSSYDMKSALQKVDIEAYKSVVVNSIPVINNIYNNGNISVSPSDTFIDMIKAFFPVSFYNSVFMINAQLSGLFSYFEPLKAREKTDFQKVDNSILGVENPVKSEESSNSIVFSNEAANAANSIADHSIPDAVNSRGMQEAVSSISTDDIEKEEPKKGEVESNGKITIRNETKNKVNINELMKEPLKFKFDKNRDKVLIFHTHTTESYIRSLSQLNTPVSTHSRDQKYNVARVGLELADKLRKGFGMQVIHNATIHDYPNFNLSYSNSLKTVTALLKKNPNTKIVIDIHRDAMGNNKKLRDVVKVNGKNAAKIMFVVATGEEKQNHPNWKENFKLALKIQEKLNEQCPQLTQPIFLSKYRFNQHVRDGALLVEIGGDGNLLEECLESTKYLAKAISDVVNAKK